MKQKIVCSIAILFSFCTMCIAQRGINVVDERQIFIPLLEIEHFTDLTPEKMDSVIPSLKVSQLVRKEINASGSIHFILNLRDENYAFMGMKLCECDTYFSTSYNPHNRITSNSVKLEFSAVSDEEALSKIRKLANDLTKSKLVRTKVRLDDCPKNGLIHGEVYKTPFFKYSADTYAAQDCYIKLSSDTPELNNSMSVGTITRKYFIELGLYNIFYKSGKEWICLANLIGKNH